MTWTNITNAQLAIGAPVRSIDLLALRDNITAQANGDAGAPKQQANGINFIANGLQNSSGALSISAPTANTVGSYCFAQNRRTYLGTGPALVSCVFGSDYAAGNGQLQIQLSGIDTEGGAFNPLTSGSPNSISGTWRWLGQQRTAIIGDTVVQGIACRVA